MSDADLSINPFYLPVTVTWIPMACAILGYCLQKSGDVPRIDI